MLNKMTDKKNRKKIKNIIVLVIALFFFMAICVWVIRILRKNYIIEMDSKCGTVVVNNDESLFSRVEGCEDKESELNTEGAYDLGYNTYHQLVFRDPSNAWRHAMYDFGEGFKTIQETYNLKQISENDFETIEDYYCFSYDVNGSNYEATMECRLAGVFLDIYENSFYEAQ